MKDGNLKLSRRVTEIFKFGLLKSFGGGIIFVTGLSMEVKVKLFMKEITVVSNSGGGLG